MLVQLNTNNGYRTVHSINNINRPCFKGNVEVGKKVLNNIKDRIICTSYDVKIKDVLKEISKEEVKNKKGIKKLLEKIRLGAFGFISLKLLNFILYEFSDEIYCRKREIKKLTKSLDTANSDLDEAKTKITNLEYELGEQTEHYGKLDEREAALKTKENSLSERLTAVQKREEDVQAKEQSLNKREQNIEKTTVARVTGQIRKEEQDKAGKAYEERIKDLETKEQSLNEKEKVLINTENIIRQAEVEKIKGELRVLYGIQDTENKNYSSFGEQMVVVASILNNSSSFDSKSQLTLRYITESLRDNEGIITSEKLQFLERILNLDDEIKEGYLHSFMCLAQDESGNLDSEKAAYLLAALSWNKEGHQKVIDDFAEYYHLKSTYENQPKEELFMALINQAVFDENMPDTELLEKIKNFDYLQECDKSALISANKKMKGLYLWLNQKDDSTSFKCIQQIIEGLERIINFKTVKGE